jgi:hypothetical protein
MNPEHSIEVTCGFVGGDGSKLAKARCDFIRKRVTSLLGGGRVGEKGDESTDRGQPETNIIA